MFILKAKRVVCNWSRNAEQFMTVGNDLFKSQEKFIFILSEQKKVKMENFSCYRKKIEI